MIGGGLDDGVEPGRVRSPTSVAADDREHAQPERHDRRGARRSSASRPGADLVHRAVDDPPRPDARRAGRRVRLVVAERDQQVQRVGVEGEPDVRRRGHAPGVWVCEWTMPQKTSSASSVAIVRRYRSAGSIS